MWIYLHRYDVTTVLLRFGPDPDSYLPIRCLIDLEKAYRWSYHPILNELEGYPLMLFYEFNHELERLKKHFPSAAVLGKGVTAKQGMEVERAWNNNETELLLLHPKTGGHGLNLQESRCRDICWLTITWDLELYEQAFSRVWRQGIEHPVTLHHITALNTMDSVVMSAIKRKTTLQDELKKALTK